MQNNPVMLCSIKPILSWKANLLLLNLTSLAAKALPWYFSWVEQQGRVGKNDQAIIVELENNPVMIDPFLIGWDWLLTGPEPFLHNKNVFHFDTPAFSTAQSEVSPQPDKTFLPSHDLRSGGDCSTASTTGSKLFIYTPAHLSILQSGAGLAKIRTCLVL